MSIKKKIISNLFNGNKRFREDCKGNMAWQTHFSISLCTEKRHIIQKSTAQQRLQGLLMCLQTRNECQHKKKGVWTFRSITLHSCTKNHATHRPNPMQMPANAHVSANLSKWFQDIIIILHCHCIQKLISTTTSASICKSWHILHLQ